MKNPARKKYFTRKRIFFGLCSCIFIFVFCAVATSQYYAVNTAPPQTSSSTTKSLPTLYQFLRSIPAMGALVHYFLPAASSSAKPQYSLTVWSSDFHISPVGDIKQIFSKFGVHMIDKSLSEHCYLTNSCERDLKVITQQNGIKLEPCPNALRRDFYDTYRTDPTFLSVDAVLCTHAASMCELFMPFNKPLIVVASTRYEIGRHERHRWQLWNDNLRRIAAKPTNTLAANNRYDQEYLKYFTGLPVVLLPSLVLYITDTYAPTRPEVLLGPSRGVNGHLQRLLFAAIDAHSPLEDRGRISLVPIRDLYPQYRYADLAAHPCVVLLPYQVSFMSFFELYRYVRVAIFLISPQAFSHGRTLILTLTLLAAPRIGVPMYVPSPTLLARWHTDLHVLSERSWGLVFGLPAPSPLPRHPEYTGSMTHDPNEESDFDGILQWISLSDFYQFPHVAQFSSFEHLATLLHSTTAVEYDAISARMFQYSRKQQYHTEMGWQAVLGAVAAKSKSQAQLPENVNDALQQEYGVTLKSGSCYSQSSQTFEHG